MSRKGLVTFEEARKYKAYPDPLTHGAPWTIGLGHTGPEVHEGLVWDDNQIDFAYQLDDAAAWQACLDHFPWYEKLDEARQAIVWSMAYQMGIGRLLGFHNTLAAIRDERYDDAAAGMRASAWDRQTPERCEREAAQLATGIWNPHYLEAHHGP